MPHETEAIGDGIVWVFVVLFLFLWNLRTSAITLTAIPLSLLITALVFRYFGVSINTMTLGGMALANARLGAVHGFAGVLGGTTGHSHGAICARLLPIVMEANIRALEGKGRHDGPCERYDEIARILTGDPAARAVDGVEWVRAVCEELKIPPLGQADLIRKDLDPIIAAAR